MNSTQPDGAPIRRQTVLALLAGLAAMTLPALGAIAFGFDYAPVVIASHWAVALALFGMYRRARADAFADRLALLAGTTLALAVAIVFVSDRLDWRPFGIGDAQAGLLIGAVLAVLGPMRYALVHARSLPGVAAFALAAGGFLGLVVAIYSVSEGRLENARTPGHLLGGLAIVGLAALGYRFATRRLGAPYGILALVLLLYALQFLAGAGVGTPAAMLGATLAGVTILGVFALRYRRELFPRRELDSGADRLGRLAGAALIAWLFVSHFFATFAIEPIGICPYADALAIVTVVLVPVAAWRALNRADEMPRLAAASIIALGVLPLAAMRESAPEALVDTAAQAPAVMIPAAASLVVLVLGFRFATRRLGDGPAFAVLLAFAAALARVGGASGDFDRLLAAGAAGTAVLAAFALQKRSAWWRSPAAGKGLLLGLTPIGAWSLLDNEFFVVTWFAAAAAIAVWWRFLYRPSPEALARGRRAWPDAPAMRAAAVAVAFAGMLGSASVLVIAATKNLTGARLLAAFCDAGVCLVPEDWFARAIVRDVSLWADDVRVRGDWRNAQLYRRHMIRLDDTRSLFPPDRWSTAYPANRDGEIGSSYGLRVDSDKGGRLRITAVAPGSPAASAGVRRGETVRAIDGRPVSEADALGLTFGLPGPARQLDLEGPDGAVRTVRVGPANFTASPVPVETIVDGGGARVGYLGLDTFEPEAMRPFLSAAKRLAAAGIAELVVDLRRNMGGSVGVARVVAGAIGGEAVRGKTFAKLGHNDRYRDLDRDVEFAIPAAGALALKRVVVLTSSETCSASESLINGLRPYMAVITIGGRTCGKPVGSRLVDYRGTRYAVISFSVANARGEGNYVSGIPPTCAIEDNYARELGDPEETLLAAALAYLRTGRCPAPADGAAGQADGAAG